MNTLEMRKELKNIKGLGDVTITRIVEHFEKKELIKPSKQWCYSWDGENYSNGLFDSKEEALKDAKDSMTDAEEVYIGIAVSPKLRWVSNEEQIIESMNENLYDDCGEYAEEGLEVTTEQEVDLGRMIDKAVEEWIDKHHIRPTCYSVIEDCLHVFEEND